MDLVALMTTFVRVVDAGSLSGAARSLRLSLPAVSRQLRALEDDLGATLLVRSTRRMQLTDAGRAWYAGSVRVLREVDEARAAVRPTADARGTLVVSTPVTIALSRIVPRLPDLLRAHPRLRVDLRLEDRVADLVGEGVDVAVRGGVPPPDSTAYIAQPVSRFTRWVVAAPAYVREHGAPRTPEQLAGHACLVQLGPAGAVDTWALVRGDARREVRVTGPLRCGAPVALRAIACAGAGVALLADWLVAEDVAAGRLRRLLPGWESAPVSIWAVYRVEHRGAPRVRAFVRWLEGGD